MANHNEDFVDINSSSQINKVYKKRNTKGRVMRTSILILSIIMLIFGTGMVYYYKVIDSIDYQEIEKIEYSTSDSKSQNQVVEKKSLLQDDNILNVLLIGRDAANGADHGRSDTVILLSIDNNSKKIKLTSFQRDTYVAIPGHGDDKLNAAFTIGGIPLTVAMVEANFGVHVDKYACVDFASFRDIIEILGGVDIELTTDEIKYINAQIDVNNQEKYTQFLTVDESVEKQMVHLDGYQALWYARNRGAEYLGGVAEYSFDGDDWDRTARQRNLLETIMKTLKEEASLTEIVEIVNSIGPYITTNLKKEDITFLVTNSLTYLSYDMVELTVPTEDTWSYGRTPYGASVIQVNDWEKLRYDVAKFIFENKVATES